MGHSLASGGEYSNTSPADSVAGTFKLPSNLEGEAERGATRRRKNHKNSLTVLALLDRSKVTTNEMMDAIAHPSIRRN